MSNPKYSLGNDIIVIGGGDTSLDCARTALRLTKGKGNVTLLCLQPETGLHVDPIMLEEAKEEGVMFRFLGQAKSFEGDSNGHVVATIIDSVSMSAPDQSGKRHPEVIPNKEFKMPSCPGTYSLSVEVQIPFSKRRPESRSASVIRSQLLMTTEHL